MSEPARTFALPDPRPARLTREEVAASQRGRLLLAMAEVAAEKGYANTVVADVIARAGVSRRTFYEQFSDKQECFLAAYDGCVDALESLLVDELERTGELRAPDQLDRMIGAYLEGLASEPALARTYLVEVYAAGPDAIARRRGVLERFGRLIATARDRLEEDGHPARELDAFTLEALVSSISTMVTTRVGSGELDELPELREPIVRFLLDNLLVERA
jgi:AcrR family transcriptional regulator